METKRNFYYIDSEGNKRKYVGKVIKNADGSFNGILTKRSCIEHKIELTYHPAIDPIEGRSEYYTYVGDNNEEVMYYSFVKTDSEGNPYFTYSLITEIPVIVHPAETIKTTYFTYMVNGEEKRWTKKVNYVKGTYIGSL